MVKRILKEIIWKRLITRFKAYTTIEKEVPELLETVQPVTNVDDLLGEPQCLADAAVDLSGGGTVTLFTVPDGKRWTLKGFYKGATVGTVYNNIVDASRASGQTFGLVVGKTAEELVHRLEYPMDQKDSIIAGGGNVADSSIIFKCFVIEEDAF